MLKSSVEIKEISSDLRHIAFPLSSILSNASPSPYFPTTEVLSLSHDLLYLGLSVVSVS